MQKEENKMKEFKSWRDIKEWFEENGYEVMAKRMVMNQGFCIS